MPVPADVAAQIDTLLEALQDVRGPALVGVYLRGSLALGDFIPSTSDVDLLAATEQPVTEDAFAALHAMHARLAGLPNPYANRMEIAYIDRAALRRFAPGQRHPTLGQGEELAWSEHGSNWILERWIVREHGLVLRGPAPATLIDPIGADELRDAVRSRLPDWVAWVDQDDDPEWRLPRSHKAYVVETMCRALYTLANGALCSKPAAVAWALRALPEPWRATVARSQSWRTDRTVDLTLMPEVARFVRWAASPEALRAIA